MNLTDTDITAALRQHLPAEFHPAIPALAQVLADATRGALNPEDAQAHLAADPNLTAALRALAGQEVNAGSSVIAFSAGAQLGDVSIGDVAGRDVVKIHLEVHQPAHGALRGDDGRGYRAAGRGDRSGLATGTQVIILDVTAAPGIMMRCEVHQIFTAA